MNEIDKLAFKTLKRLGFKIGEVFSDDKLSEKLLEYVGNNETEAERYWYMIVNSEVVEAYYKFKGKGKKL